MFKDAFFEIETSDAEKLLSQINDISDLSDFEAETTRLLTHPLSFYPGYHILVASDQHQNPQKKISFIYREEEMIILDGTASPFDQIGDKGALSLTEQTIEEYVRFYFTYVRAPEGHFYLVDSPDHIPWIEEPSPVARRAIAKMLSHLKIKKSDPKGGFLLIGSLFFKNALFETEISVDSNGKIQLSNQELLVDDLPAVASF